MKKALLLLALGMFTSCGTGTGNPQADFDGDGTIDIDDRTYLEICYQEEESGDDSEINTNTYCDNADLNGDSTVNDTDVEIFESAFSAPAPGESDFNQDGSVDEKDYVYIRICLGANTTKFTFCVSADLDGNGSVQFADLTTFRESFVESTSSTDEGDLNGDGATDIMDYAYFKICLFQTTVFWPECNRADLNDDTLVGITDFVTFLNSATN